jgi:hypothetical protein
MIVSFQLKASKLINSLKQGKEYYEVMVAFQNL